MSRIFRAGGRPERFEWSPDGFEVGGSWPGRTGSRSRAGRCAAADMAAGACTIDLRFGCGRSVEPEHPFLRGPGVRQSLSEGGNSQAFRRRAIGDGLDDLWRQKRERDKSADVPLDQTFSSGDLIKGRSLAIENRVHPAARADDRLQQRIASLGVKARRSI